MNYTLSAVCVSVSLLISVLLPVFLLVVWHRKTGARLLPALVGAVIFPVFALGLEQLCHTLVLNHTHLYLYPYFYAAYGCLAAGLFEETGRLVAFRFLLKKHRNPETSVTYGIGHGGIEAILVSGVSMAVLLLAAVLLAGGNGQRLTDLFGEATAQSLTLTLAGNAPWLYLFSGFERAVAILLHISLSVFVFKAVTAKKPVYYVLAILLHASVNAFAALYQIGVLKNILLVELFVLLSTLCVAFFAFRIYRTMPRASRDPAGGPGADAVSE